MKKFVLADTMRLAAWLPTIVHIAVGTLHSILELDSVIVNITHTPRCPFDFRLDQTD